jgi:hypothetical protein
LAAANCLLLKGSIELPSNCVGAGVVTIDQLVNVLAEKILSTNTGSDSDHHIQEVLTVFPSLQFGLDVNPKFTSGPQGVEYTMQLNAFDLLRVELVHGWLLEPEAEEYDLIANQSYNQLINVVIQGNDAGDQLQRNPQAPNQDALSEMATKGTLVRHFLDRSAHQLTQYGLTVLHEFLKDGQIVVFFRNNHFNTLCKHNGLLYLLVTDLGYADVASVAWEKIDVIDGDTEYVTGDFLRPPPIEQHHASTAATGEQLVSNNNNNMQSQADYQLALQLSRETFAGGSALPSSAAASTTAQQDAEMEAALQASLLHHRPPTTTATTTTTTTSGTTATMATIPPAASSSNTTTTATTNPAAAAAATVTTPATTTPGTPTTAVGVPTQAPTQEIQDHMIAMQIQRQEEQDRANRMRLDKASTGLASAMQKREKHVQRARVSRPAPPPGRLPTAPNPYTSARDSNCVIS